MAIKRAAITCTSDGASQANSASTLLHIPANGNLKTFIEAVQFDDSGSAAAPIDVSIFEVDSSGYEANQLFHADQSDGSLQPLMFPRLAGQDAVTGVAQTETGRPLCQQSHIIVKVNVQPGGSTSDVFTVTVFYETSGDYRF